MEEDGSSSVLSPPSVHLTSADTVSGAASDAAAPACQLRRLEVGERRSGRGGLRRTVTRWGGQTAADGHLPLTPG